LNFIVPSVLKTPTKSPTQIKIPKDKQMEYLKSPKSPKFHLPLLSIPNMLKSPRISPKKSKSPQSLFVSASSNFPIQEKDVGTNLAVDLRSLFDAESLKKDASTEEEIIGKEPNYYVINSEVSLKDLEIQDPTNNSEFDMGDYLHKLSPEVSLDEGCVEDTDHGTEHERILAMNLQIIDLKLSNDKLAEKNNALENEKEMLLENEGILLRQLAEANKIIESLMGR